MEARYFSMRACSKPASARSCEARTKTPGRPRTAPGLGREEEYDLLGLERDRNRDALFANFFVPGLDFGEPVVGGRVSRATQKGRYQKVMDGLGWRQVWVKPDLVARLQVGNFGDRQGLACASDVDLNLRAGQIKAARVRRVQHCACEGERSENSEDKNAAEELCHHSILDGEEGLWV